MQLTTFEPFPRLPLEIRLLIWKLAIQPRVVSVVWKDNLGQFITPEIPALLHVSHEARAEALQAYGKHHTTDPLEPDNKIYFNYEIDALMVDCKPYGAEFVPGFHDQQPYLSSHRERVKFVVVDAGDLNFAPGIAVRSGGAALFPVLEEFAIIDDEYHDDTYGLWEGDRTLEVLNTWVGGKEKMPVLKCLTRGYDCNNHWWFKGWNDCREREVGSWGTAYFWVQDGAYRCRTERIEDMVVVLRPERLLSYSVQSGF